MLLFALLASEVATLVLVLLHAQRRTVPRVLVLLATFALIDEVVVASLHAFVFTATKHPVLDAIARLGWIGRAAYHVETAFVLGWPTVLAACAWWTFVPRPPPWAPRAQVVAYLVTLGAMVALFPLDPPDSGAPRTTIVLRAFEVVMVGSAVLAVRRGRRRSWWGTGHDVVGLLLSFEVVVVIAGPFARDLFHRWDVAHGLYLIGFTSTALLLVARLRRPTAPR